MREFQTIGWLHVTSWRPCWWIGTIRCFLLLELTSIFMQTMWANFILLNWQQHGGNASTYMRVTLRSCLVLVFGWLRKTKGANSAYPRVPEPIHVHFKIPDSWQYHKNATSLFHSHVQSTELRLQNHPVQHNKQHYKKEWIWIYETYIWTAEERF